jgi:DNA-binding beta-propeller fold protein YncE
MKRLLLAVSVVLAGACLVGWRWWDRAEDETRQRIRIRVMDFRLAMGWGLPARDLAHMRKRSGLEDVANVNCRNCHLESTNALAWAQPRVRHASPGGLAVTPDGRRLYVGLPERDEVAAVDLVRLVVIARARVAGQPTGLALAPDGLSLFVTCRAGDRVARLDLARDGMLEVESVSVGIQPVGIACGIFGTNQLRLVVANTTSDDASVLSVDPLRETARFSTGREPYGVGFSEDGRRVQVVSRLAVSQGLHQPPASEITVFDTQTQRVTQRSRLDSAHLSESIAAVPGSPRLLVPLVRVRNLVPITQVARGWVMSSGLGVVEPDGSVVQMPLDEANRYFADPGGLVIEANGRRAFLASGGGDVVTVVALDQLDRWLEQSNDAQKRSAIHDLELAGEYVVGRIPTGRNPREMALSPDGSRLFVSERLDDAVLVLDTRSLKPVGRVVLGEGGMNDPVRRGERWFTWAGKTFQGQFSCRSCHPDGHFDGLTYDFDGDGIGDNLLDNRSLLGLAGTWPFKWNGKNPSLNVQCGPRFAKVLMRTDPFDDEQLADLTRYVESLPPARTRHIADTGWTVSQERGRQLFFATQTPDGTPIPEERRCSTCHRPPLYTNRSKSSVGTRGPRDVSDVFDTPHLLGIGASAPYLHDGRAKSLEELWTLYQTNDLHGVSSYMSKQQLNDLVDFLKAL